MACRFKTVQDTMLDICAGKVLSLNSMSGRIYVEKVSLTKLDIGLRLTYASTTSLYFSFPSVLHKAHTHNPVFLERARVP
jgi:hypothetical protein